MGIFSRISGMFLLLAHDPVHHDVVDLDPLLAGEGEVPFCVGGAEGRLGDGDDIFGRQHGEERAVGPPAPGQTQSRGVADLVQRRRVLAVAALEAVLDGQQLRDVVRDDELELRQESPSIDEELVEDLLRNADLVHEDGE